MGLEEDVGILDGQERVVNQETELGSVMKNLDSDKVDTGTRMSNIDFNARLSGQEINASLVFDELVRLGILPEEAGLTRQKKRLSVSLEGKGREEKVRIVQGERDSQAGSTFGNRFMNLFKRQE